MSVRSRKIMFLGAKVWPMRSADKLTAKNSALSSQKCIGISDVSPNSPPPTNYYFIKQYWNPSGPMVYNSGALLPTPTLKFWNDCNLRSCAWLWTSLGMSLIHSSEGTSAALQSKTKSVVTALTRVIDFAPIPIILRSTFFGCLDTRRLRRLLPNDLPDRI
jgi:hypothetical protein